jgi:hypothetical protein
MKLHREARDDPRAATLEHIWTFHRLQLLLLAEGSTTSMEDQRGGAAKSRPPKPAGQELCNLEGRWAECTTNHDRRCVVRDAQEILRGYKFPKADPRTSRGTAEWRLQIALDARPMPMITQFWGVSERTVYYYRDEFKDIRVAA